MTQDTLTLRLRPKTGEEVTSLIVGVGVEVGSKSTGGMLVLYLCVTSFPEKEKRLWG